MFNDAFDAVGARAGDYYPESLRCAIDPLNERIYQDLNNGVYKAGFATSQETYEEAALAVFTMLDELQERLARSRYLFGERPVETDWRLFTTLVLFMSVTSNAICAVWSTIPSSRVTPRICSNSQDQRDGELRTHSQALLHQSQDD